MSSTGSRAARVPRGRGVGSFSAQSRSAACGVPSPATPCSVAEPEGVSSAGGSHSSVRSTRRYARRPGSDRSSAAAAWAAGVKAGTGAEAPCVGWRWRGRRCWTGARRGAANVGVTGVPSLRTRQRDPEGRATSSLAVSSLRLWRRGTCGRGNWLGHRRGRDDGWRVGLETDRSLSLGADRSRRALRAPRSHARPRVCGSSAEAGSSVGVSEGRSRSLSRRPGASASARARRPDQE